MPTYRPPMFPRVALGDTSPTALRAAQSRATTGFTAVRASHGALALVPPAADPFAHQVSTHLATAFAASKRTSAFHALSRETAALCHGIDIYGQPPRPALTSPHHLGARSSRDYVRHCEPLPPEDVILLDRIPCTTLERTAVDCARYLPPLRGLVIAGQVLRALTLATRFTREVSEPAVERVRRELIARVAALPAGARGARRALTVIEHASAWTESPPEVALLRLILVWGRRDVVAQQLVVANGRRYFTDLALPDGLRPDGSPRWVHIEYDGELKYGHGTQSVQVLLEERDRERAILALGDSMVRVTSTSLRSPEGVIADISSALIAPARLRPVTGLR